MTSHAQDCKEERKAAEHSQKVPWYYLRVFSRRGKSSQVSPMNTWSLDRLRAATGEELR